MDLERSHFDLLKENRPSSGKIFALLDRFGTPSHHRRSHGQPLPGHVRYPEERRSREEREQDSGLQEQGACA